ncbi:DUF406 family protein [Shewanella psychrotolerans]|uniref:DUF406 family protein n=1 Tax=Shewanella psychrotolerans TaxID=2864206 RepID=UPI001C656B28|nr:DUF406 family protein [Shewanella psychrotolerans]QYJ99909.1 YfcZ/YiiS family protein [Shewanella psychrotolerans]
MKNIEKGQSALVNDTCTDCGSYADIGAVIDEHDTVLVIEKHGADALAEVESLANAAKVRFDAVQAEIVDIVDGQQLSLTFAFSAEKMIFQLQNNL